jgi:hypothetical protein
MSITAYNRDPSRNWSYLNFNFRVFKSSEDFIKQVTDANLSENKTFRKQSEYKQNYEDSQYQNVVTYNRAYSLKEMLDNFEEIYDSIDMGGAFKKKKLLITDDKRGIFSFGIASKGLYRAIEYFSEEIKIDDPIELKKYNKPLGVVPADLVQNIVMLGEKEFWYTSDTTNKMYKLTRQQEGTAIVVDANPNTIIKETEAGLKYPEPQSFGNAGVKFKTSTKKSYLMFDKKGGKAEMVELYMPIHAEFELENALPVFLIAKYLTSMGIKVRISAIRMYLEQGIGTFYMWAIPIKDYGEEMDFNKMALVGVDNRWWQLVKVGVKTFSKIQTGSWVEGGGSQAGNEADYVEAFARYRNWYDEQIKLGLLEPLRVDKKLVMIAGLINIPYNITYEQAVLNEFYRVMDRIDFYFNKPYNVVDRIYKRIVEKESENYFVSQINNGVDYSTAISDAETNKRMLVSKMKTYVQQVLSDTYTYPIGGKYPEKQESADMMEEEFDKKLQEMNMYLKNL